MDYEVIIIGASFFAVGMSCVSGEKCLILDRRPQAGYEFTDAMKNRMTNEKPKTVEGQLFSEKLNEKGFFTPFGNCIFNTVSTLYSYLSDKNILFNIEILKIEKIKGGFAVTCHSVSGIRIFTAKRVINTLPLTENIKSKSINMLIAPKSKEIQPIKPFADISVEECGFEFDRICKLPLLAEDDYISARAKIYERTLLPEFSGYVLEYVADYFDITVYETAPKEIDGITYIPSCGFDNCILAFDAGVIFAKEEFEV